MASVAASKASDGKRDLALILASGSTARVLNLARVNERFSGAEEYAAAPLFRCAKLNRALILKHTLRPHERPLFERPEPHTTKIIFPYSATELGLGGTSVMYGERRFDQMLRGAVGANVDDEAFGDDVDLLNVLHEMPSFDPFLLREQLRRSGRAPARCYFEISDADIAVMLEFVGAEIEPLARMAFAAIGRRAANLAMRLAEKLMTDETAKLLDPLRETLRLSPAEYAQGVFAWKGFLYYKWLMSGFADKHQAFQSRFANCAIIGGEGKKRREAADLRNTVAYRMDVVARRCAELIEGYASAFAALTKGSPLAFRDFLLQAPAQFALLGEATGALKHIHSYWEFRFSPAAPLSMEAEEALDVLQEFDVMLSGVELEPGEESRELYLA